MGAEVWYMPGLHRIYIGAPLGPKHTVMMETELRAYLGPTPNSV